MSKTKTAHIISHTHWDREWYLPYEKHHVRLVELIDVLLDKLEQGPDYRSFFLDGQTIILEDYLQVRPGQKDRLEALIQAGRLIIGPWYILQDAFLTSGEANIRNMQIGHQDAARYGQPAKIGYYPDTFGLTGQTPQLMRQAGINNVFFGRGVKPTGFNNTVSDGGYESSYSELLWEGPDGSKVLGVLFANWYSNGNEVPANEAEARGYWERKLADAEKYASTGELLFMNGCDHQPVQLDLPEAIAAAQRLYPDVRFVHSNFPDYVKALEGALDRELSNVYGELRSQRTDGWGTLVNTASSRVYLKQMNQLGQALLEKAAEPLAAIASMDSDGGIPYPHDILTYGWKTLMQNHPHDSICGCSVDEVHREMVTRFDKSRHVAESVIASSVTALTERIDTSAFQRFGEKIRPVVVFNTTGTERTGVVTMEADAERLYFRDGFSLEEGARRMKVIDLSACILVDDAGVTVACTIRDLGLQFGYDLPGDKFRQPYFCRRVELTFEAERVPALGWRTYALVSRPEEGEALAIQVPAAAGTLSVNERVLENNHLRVEVSDDGSFALTDKATGRVFRDMGIYEDTGDIGNEYMFKQPAGELPLTTKGLPARVSVAEHTAYRGRLEIVHEWEVPAAADEGLEQEQHELVYYPLRRSGRSRQTAILTIRTVLSLERSGKGLEIESSFVNTAKDHRIRMLFPTDITAATHLVDSMFEVVERPIEPAPEWENPSNTQHQQAFVDVAEAGVGLTVANLGLNEYEVLRDGRSTIAVTLLRSVGELGDWGLFPTPEAQCLGEHSARLKLIPHDGDGIRSGAFEEAYQFQVPWICAATGQHKGDYPPLYSFAEWQGEGLAFSSLKRNEQTGDMLLRWYNMKSGPTTLSVKPKTIINDVYKSNILEERLEQISSSSAGEILLPVKGNEIITIALSFK